MIKLKLVGIVTCVNIFLGAIVGLLLQYALSQYAFAVYPYIPLFFIALECVMIGLMSSNNKKPTQVVAIYMIQRICKLILVAIAFGLYALLSGKQMIPFAVVLVLFYLINLVVETYAFYALGKVQANKGEEEQK